MEIQGELFTIGGKLIRVKQSIHLSDLLIGSTDTVKERMVEQLVRYIIDEGFVEFVKRQDLNSFNDTLYATIYLAPNDQVKVLRSLSGMYK